MLTCADTFSNDFFNGASTPMDTHGQSLLSDMEGQSLADFFSNTDPFSLSDAPPFGASADTKLAANDFSDWNFMAPATVHQVSATIPDQAQLHHGFHGDNMFATQPLQLDHMGTTHDDLQAASTLFNNSQHPAYLSSRSHSFHDMSASTSSHNSHLPHHHHAMSGHAHNGRPMVATSQGLLNEQLAALLPNHDAAGTLDAQLAAHWAGSDAHHRVQEEFTLPRPTLKRTYTFGTDNSFSNPTGFTAPHNETEEQVTRRLMRDMEHTQAFIPTLQHTPDTKPPVPASPTTSDSTTSPSSDDDDQPTKKRKKSTQIKKESIRKTAPGGRVSKPKKPSEADSKKKRISAAAQKLQRENLSEEQKRNNHILSEQKRRNLIKRGFDDLHDLVPEIRNGGLSKSSVLMEAANFLDKLIQDNNELARLISGEVG